MPIVVTDQYGNEYTTSVQVEVAARNKKNADDFDWDESVIYFMVTDRFFDGNEVKQYSKWQEQWRRFGCFARFLADLASSF